MENLQKQLKSRKKRRKKKKKNQWKKNEEKSININPCYGKGKNIKQYLLKKEETMEGIHILRGSQTLEH